jgi:exodeoxyribonuclease III
MKRGEKMIRMISWNVNGLRACIGKGFVKYFNDINADIFSIQETKLQEGQIELEFDGYNQYWNYAKKKGYSGTAVFTKSKPVSVWYGMGIDEHDTEGRIITLEFKDFFHVTVYTPNSQRELARLKYRMKWETDFQKYLKYLEKEKPVIVCGDMNVAHNDIDLKNPSSNRKHAGFTDEERKKFSSLVNSGFIDTYRYFYPDRKDAYTWWSYMFNAREKNVGWRIDYFCISSALENMLKNAYIYNSVMGSDHCPVGIEIF